jgi:hypothetical protein
MLARSLRAARLNLLDFQWKIPDTEAKWHHYYHQLRRFKLIHGHTEVPHDYNSKEEYDWVMVGRYAWGPKQL